MAVKQRLRMMTIRDRNGYANDGRDVSGGIWRLSAATALTQYPSRKLSRPISNLSTCLMCLYHTVSGKHLTFSEAYIIIQNTTQFTICSIFVNRRIRTNTIREQSNKEHSKPTLRLHIRIFAASSDDNICILLVYCMLPPEFRIEFL